MSKNGDNAAAARQEAIGLGELENHLGYFVRRVQHWIFRDVNATLAAVELDVVRYSILETVAANAGVTQIAAAGALGVERARMVALLDDLQEAGLILRQRSVADRRAHALHLTPRGRIVLKKANALVAAHEEKVIRRLGTEAYHRALAALAQFDLD